MRIEWPTAWDDDSFKNIFERFHSENPEAWDRMKEEK